MVKRSYIKCEVCDSVILTRIQIGWLSKHPIRIHCPKCNILISGELFQDQQKGRFNYYFKNGNEVFDENTEINYYVEVSGELLTSKIKPFEKGDLYLPSPFIRSLTNLDYAENFKKKIIFFLHFIEHDWPFIRRIHELWLLKKYEYLNRQMRPLLDKKQFPLNNELEYLRGIHQLFLIKFYPVLSENFFETASIIQKSIPKMKIENYEKLTNFFKKSSLLDNYEQRCFNILNLFVEKFPFFITAMGLEGRKFDLKTEGITTTSFEDLKHFYLDCFETIGEIAPLVVAYNNIEHRKDFKIMPEMVESDLKKIKTLDDYIKMGKKGKIIKFCKIDEKFNCLVGLEDDNGLRNAIGHGTYLYDGIKQEITYYEAKNKIDEAKKIYLVEFIQKTLKQFKAIIILIELIYQTKKNYYVFSGIKPVNPNVFLNELKGSASCDLKKKKKEEMNHVYVVQERNIKNAVENNLNLKIN